MSRRSGVSVLEVLLAFFIVIVLAAVLFPVFAKHPGCGPGSNCQSNMTQIGRAIKMYLTDWDYTYPTNCTRSGRISETVRLSPYAPEAQRRFVYGTNWTEGLFNYIEATTKQSDTSGVWRCANCSDETYPAGSDTAAVSYVFNRNLIQLPEGYITNAASTMMVRETDRLVNADLRPVNLSRKNPKAVPQPAFLTSKDVRMGETNPELHSKGSHILFVDGHVKYFSREFFPDKPQWDPQTQQWWNRVSAKPGIDKTIAITP